MPLTLEPYFRDEKGARLPRNNLYDRRLGFRGREPAAAAAAAAVARAADDKQTDENRPASVVPRLPDAAHPVDLKAVEQEILAIFQRFTLPPRRADRLAAEKRLKQLRAKQDGKTTIKVKMQSAAKTGARKRKSKSKKARKSGPQTILEDELIPADVIALTPRETEDAIAVEMANLTSGRGGLDYGLIELWNGYLCIFLKERDATRDAQKEEEDPTEWELAQYMLSSDFDDEQRAAMTWTIYCQLDDALQEACYSLVKADGTAPVLQAAPAGGQPAVPAATNGDGAAGVAAAPANTAAADVKPDHKMADDPQPRPAAAAAETAVLQSLKRISIGMQDYEYLDETDLLLTGEAEIRGNRGIFNRGWEGVFRQFTINAGVPIGSDAAVKIPEKLAYLFKPVTTLSAKVTLDMYDKRGEKTFPRKGPAARCNLPAIWIPKRMFDYFYDEDDPSYAIAMQGDVVRRLDYPDPSVKGAEDSSAYRVVGGELLQLFYKALSDASGGGGGGMRSDSPDEALYHWNGDLEVGIALGLDEARYLEEAKMPEDWKDCETATPKARTPMRTAVPRDDGGDARMDSEIRYWKQFPNPVVPKWKNAPLITIPASDRDADDLMTHLADYGNLVYTKKRKGAWREALGPKKAVPIGSQIGKRASAGAVMDAALRAIGGIDGTVAGAAEPFDLTSATQFVEFTIEDPLAKQAWAAFSSEVELWDAEEGAAEVAPPPGAGLDAAAAGAAGSATGGAAPKPRAADDKDSDAKPAAAAPSGMGGGGAAADKPAPPAPARMDIDKSDAAPAPAPAPAPAAGGGGAAADAADGGLRMFGADAGGQPPAPARPREPEDAPGPRAKERALLRTQQEWCHLVGHGDGGDEVFENFIAGSKHCNTEQLAIETGQRTARRTYGQTGDDKSDPIALAVKVTAYLFPNNGIGAKRQSFLASEITFLRVLGLLVPKSVYHPDVPDIPKTTKAILDLLEEYEIYKISREADGGGKDKPAATASGSVATASGSATTASLADPFAAVLEKASTAGVRLAKDSDETPAATWWRLWQEAAAGGATGAKLAGADAKPAGADGGARRAAAAEKREARVAVAALPSGLGAAGIAAAPAAGDDKVATDVVFKKRRTDAGTAIPTASGAPRSDGSADAEVPAIPWNRVSEDLRERLAAILALPLPMGNFIRYKIFFNKRSTAAKEDTKAPTTWVKVFDHTFDAQKESFDFFQYKIVETTVRRVIATKAGKDTDYRLEIRNKANKVRDDRAKADGAKADDKSGADSKDKAGAQAKEGSATATANANPAAGPRPIAGTVAMDRN